MTDWRWNATAGRYIDAATGQFLSRDYALGLIEQSIQSAIDVTDTLAGYVKNGLINVNDWTELMRAEIKDEYIRQYLAGIGGVEMMTPSDWGKIGAMLKDQYGYLKGFAEDLPNLSEGQIRLRASMYVDSAREANERAHATVANSMGFDLVGWVPNPDLENCPTCLARADAGFVEAGPRGGFMDDDLGKEVFPADGNSFCLTHCGCHLIYKNSKTGDTFEEL